MDNNPFKVIKHKESMEESLRERGEYIIKGVDPHEDERGKINNFHLPQPINLLATITSKKETIRANHYHPIQQQMCLVMSGSYVSVYKDLAIPNATIKQQVVKAGDLSIMPPMVAHTMIFLEDTVFLNLVGGNRDSDKFGEHTIKYELIKPEEVQSYILKYSTQ